MMVFLFAPLRNSTVSKKDTAYALVSIVSSCDLAGGNNREGEDVLCPNLRRTLMGPPPKYEKRGQKKEKTNGNKKRTCSMTILVTREINKSNNNNSCC